MIRELIKDVAGYPGLFLLCIASGTLVPLPEDFALLYAGMRIAAGEAEWLPVLVVTIIGVGIRDVIAYGAGRIGGEWLLSHRWVLRLIGGAERLIRARQLIDRHGARAVLMGRFAVGFRAPIFLASGAMGLPLRRFIAYDGLGLTIAVPITLSLGFHVGQPMVDAMYWSLQSVRVLVGLAVVALLVVWWRRRSRSRDPEG